MNKPIELVKWVDSAHNITGWHHLEDSHITPSQCYSCGFVINETDDHIIIASHYSPKDDDNEATACGDMAIPKVAILERKVL